MSSKKIGRLFAESKNFTDKEQMLREISPTNKNKSEGV